MIDFGETFSSPNYEIRDTLGALQNAGTVTATITLPDGTTDASPADFTVNNPSAGVYTFDYQTTQAGRHQVLVSATGGVLGSLVRRWVDTFDVRAADPGFVVSLADMKIHLNITSGTYDEELRGFLEAATGIIEFRIGAVVRRTLVETYDGGCAQIRLRTAPVISITTVKESGTTLAATAYALRGSAHPRLTKISGTYPVWFGYGINNVEVTYVVGRPIIPGNATLAAKIIVQHLWETQRPPSVRRPPTALAGELVAAQDQFGRTFSIPRKAVELLEPQMRVNFA